MPIKRACRHVAPGLFGDPETGFSWVECIEAVANDVRVLFARLKSLSLATVKSF
jgi:hypothetical protein